MCPKNSSNAGVRARRALPMLTLLVSLAACGCSSINSSSNANKPYAMGEKVRVGALTFTVLETDWKSQLGEGPSVKLPGKRFLLVKMAITNSGGSEAGVPYLTLEDAEGHTFREVQEGAAIPDWLGVFRRIQPAQTEQGNIAFDVAPSAYRLRLSDGAEPEATAMVDLPLQMR